MENKENQIQPDVQTNQGVSDEVKTQVITEYLKSLLSQSPKVNLSGVGVEISSPKSKPKTFAEAAKYTVEQLNNKH